MKFKTITREVTSDEITNTADCVALLNAVIGSGKWKRKTKFNLPGGFEQDPQEVRIFTNGILTVTIVATEYYTTIFNFDLSTIRNVINDVQNVAKNYHTVDYGDIYLNPFQMSLWVVCGDGGLIYSPMLPQVVAKAINNGTMDFDDDAPGFEDFIDSITSTEFEAECYPYDEAEPENENLWVRIGAINDLCNYGF